MKHKKEDVFMGSPLSMEVYISGNYIENQEINNYGKVKRIFHIAGNYIEKQEFTITGGTNYINTPEDNSERQQEEDDHTDGVPYELQKKGGNIQSGETTEPRVT